VVVPEADPAAPEVVWRERRHAGVAARSKDGHAQAILRADRKERRLKLAILACGKTIEDDAEEIVGKLDPSRPRLGHLGTDEPAPSRLVEVSDASALELTDATASRVQDQQTEYRTR
jgi:hypothetical protein